MKTIQQTNTPPHFENEEIKWLYEKDFRIPTDQLTKILSLPRTSVISDLEKVLLDSIQRHQYFLKKEKSSGVTADDIFFPMHAMYLLGELKANESLDLIFQIFRQGEDFLEFWFHELITECFVDPLLNLVEQNIEKYEAFLKEPNIYIYAKSEVSKALVQLALHKPVFKEKVIEVYDRVFTFYCNANKEDNVLDHDLISLVICDTIDIQAYPLTNVIKELFKLKYINETICGNYESVHRDISEEIIRYDPKIKWLSLVDTYTQIVDEWYRKSDEGKGYSSHAPVLKIGRNDPCLCGSGKKYKKCCLQ